VPVYNIGLASDLPDFREVDRQALGFTEDEFVFLFVYDALSSYGRKNPTKALDAFIGAFAPRFDGVRFVLKVSNLNKFPASQAEILALQEKYPAITVIDEYLTRDGVLDLMAAADVYISLHAAEGYGLTILEAMALGTPSICTGYSGNMDFTSDLNSWLVDYKIISTTEPTGPYPEDSVWASPSVDSATDLMRHVAANRDEVAVKAELARTDALEAASLEAYARRLEVQLRRVGV
jgi:glycosyltransferase involved in cell wall biosynthesis